MVTLQVRSVSRYPLMASWLKYLLVFRASSRYITPTRVVCQIKERSFPNSNSVIELLDLFASFWCWWIDGSSDSARLPPSVPSPLGSSLPRPSFVLLNTLSSESLSGEVGLRKTLVLLLGLLLSRPWRGLRWFVLLWRLIYIPVVLRWYIVRPEKTDRWS